VRRRVRLGVSKTGINVEKFFGFVFRRQIWVGEQGQCQRLNASFTGYLRLGTAFLLVGQIQVFKTLLGFGIADLGFQFLGQFALFFDAAQDGCPPVFEIAQIGQALFEVAQLSIVEAIGGFLAVARDKRHGSAFIQGGRWRR
jgi:hypothetical protein